MCPHCRAFITSKDRVCPYCGESVGPRAVDRRNPSDLLGGLIPHARFNTVLILTINLGLYLLTVVYSMRAGNGSALMSLDALTRVKFGAKYGPYLHAGEWWRLITAGFLHGGLFHILMNSWVLFDVGSQVEEIYGASRMWVIYTVANICGFYSSYRWNPMVPSMGASAAVMGLIGAMIALGMTHRSALGDAIRGQYIRWVIWILIIGLLPGMAIDNAAHVGGLAAGFGIAYVAGIPRYEGAAAEKLWKAAAGFCVVITLVSFLEMFLAFARNAQ